MDKYSTGFHGWAQPKHMSKLQNIATGVSVSVELCHLVFEFVRRHVLILQHPMLNDMS